MKQQITVEVGTGNAAFTTRINTDLQGAKDYYGKMYPNLNVRQMWNAKFTGRLSGSQGVDYEQEALVSTSDYDKARLELYEKYEHIRIITITDT
jgi:hypothetical protein